jgi:hypothetical protein
MFMYSGIYSQASMDYGTFCPQRNILLLSM